MTTDLAATTRHSTPTDASSKAGRGPGVGPAILLLVIALLLSAALCVVGGLRLPTVEGWILLAAGGLGLSVSLAVASLVLVVLRGPVAQGAARLGDRLEDQLRPARQDLQRMTKLLGDVSDHGLISDRAKRIAYRDRDREAIRQAIEEDLLAEDYASARQLADEFERSFGYKHEAERFRDEIRRRIEDARGTEIDDAGVKIGRLCDQEDWAGALAEADRIAGRYGGDMKVRLLRTRVEERRQQRKVELVEQFHHRRASRDAEGASDLLRKLDAYLTPEEGQELQAEAREVLRDRMLNLKDQYSRAMKGHDYTEAIRVGTIIRRDYPKSQLAKEAASAEPRLRERAGLEPAD
jgi:hypothetical protein